MSILESRIDLFGLARFILRDFVLPAISQSTLYGLIGTVVFFNAGLVVYYFGVTSNSSSFSVNSNRRSGGLTAR